MWRQRISVNGEARAARVKSDICMYIIYKPTHTYLESHDTCTIDTPEDFLGYKSIHAQQEVPEHGYQTFVWQIT